MSEDEADRIQLVEVQTHRALRPTMAWRIGLRMMSFLRHHNHYQRRRMMSSSMWRWT